MSKIIKRPLLSAEAYRLKLEKIIRQELAKAEVNLKERSIKGLAKRLAEETGGDEKEESSLLEMERKRIEDELRKKQKEIREAEERLQEVEGKKKEIEGVAHREGFNRGRVEGEEGGIREVKGKFNFLERLIEQIEKERKEIISSAEDEVVRLAFLVAKKIVGEEITLNPEVVVNVTKSAIKRVVEKERIKIKVNPGDWENLKKAEAELKAEVLGIGALEIVEDPLVEAGGCIIETKAGNIDARISQQEKEVEKSLGVKGD